MKKTNDKHKGRRIVQAVLCLCLAAAMVIGFVPETLSVFSVQAEEAQVNELSEGTAVGNATEGTTTDETVGSTTGKGSAGSTETVGDSTGNTTTADSTGSTGTTVKDNSAGSNDNAGNLAGSANGTISGNGSESSKENADGTTGGTTDGTTAGSTDASETETTTAESNADKNLKVLTADNSSQRKEQAESKKELSTFVSAKITAKTDFAEGDTAKVSVATEDSLAKLQIALDKYLAKENKELSKINLPLEIGYVNADGVEQEKKEEVTVKLTFEDDTVYEDLKELDKEGKLSLYHQKKNEGSTAASDETAALSTENNITAVEADSSTNANTGKKNSNTTNANTSKENSNSNTKSNTATDTDSNTATTSNSENTWEKLSYKFVDKTETAEAYIEFTTKSFSPFFFVQTKAKETNATANNALAANTFEAEGGAALNDTTISIDRYEIGFSEGATKTDGKYVWAPSTNTSGHAFVYDLNYTVSGDEITEKGALKFTLPLHILKDRDGNWADTFECPYILESEVNEGDEPEFVYTIDEAKNEVTIYNYASFSGGTSGYIEISYTTTKTPINYVDMAAQDSVKSTITATGSQGGSASKSTAGAPVYIDTNADISSTLISSLSSGDHYSSWQSSWGERPDDADNYYYVIWVVQSDISNNTQPYNLKIEDTFSDFGGSVVGYKFAGQSTFSSANELANIDTSHGNVTRYDYVLTRYEKAQADEELKNNGSYTVNDKVKVTLTPADGVDPKTSTAAAQSYTYRNPTYEKPTAYFSLYEEEVCRTHYPCTSDYTLGDLVDKTKASIEPLSYTVSMTSYPASYTLADGATGTEDDAMNGKYSQKSVDYELTDDTFYLGSTENKLNDDDYDIASLEWSVLMNSASYNSETKKFVTEKITNYSDTDKVTLWVRTDESTWKNAAVWDMSKDDYSSYDSSLVASYSGKSITFASGIKGVRLTCSNAYYYTNLGLRPSVSLKGTENVLNIVGDSDRIGLINDSTAKMSQSGKEIFNRSDSATDYIVKIDPKSSITKVVTGTKNEKISSNCYTTWRISAEEYYTDNSGKVYIPQEGGTFYDLLPNGAQLDVSSVEITASGNTLDAGSYTISQKGNYKNTGRTLVTIKINETTNTGYRITYTTVHAYEAIQDYGKSLLNSVAYETGNDKIAGGFADDGGKLTDKTIMSDLDSETDAKKFLYAEKRYYIEILMGQYAGLTKQVRSDSDSEYSKETYVNKGGSYSYKIRVGNNKLDRSKNLIFFDSIENYYQTADQTSPTKESEWKGTLTDIDLSVLKQSGAEPVVYLSAANSLNVAAHHDLSEKDADGENIWLEQSAFVEKYGSIGKATAVAVDASKKADGTDFILEAGKAVRITLYMTAPESIDSGNIDAESYNNAFLSLGRITGEGSAETITADFVHHDYTTAHYRVSNTIALKKVDKTNIQKTIKGAKYLLRGTSDYGTEYNESLTSGNNGNFSFTEIEKGSYELVETSCTNDWFLDTNVYNVTVGTDGQVQIEGLEKGTDGRFILKDAPRIHADLAFKKIDCIDTSKGLNGVQFVLTGTSDYGTDVFMHAESSGKNGAVEAGNVFFENLELGTYKLSETATKEGYILSKTEWTVKVDERGVAVLKDSEGEEITKGTDGIYRVENEPLHSIRFVKTSTYGDNITLEGAKFSLTGVSNYGTNTNATATSDSDGIVVIEGLESGTYQLKETKAPEDHELNTTAYKVIVSKDGSFEIEGLGTTTIGTATLYDFKDVKNTGTVKLTKVWKDDSTNSKRAVPDMTIATTKPSKNPDGYTITFNANGGNFTIDGKSATTNDIVYSTTGEILSGTYYTPTSTSGTFKGWYTAATGGEKYKNVGTDGKLTTPLTEDVTLYAQYNTTIKYAVLLYGIETDDVYDGVDDSTGAAKTVTGGLTFGPAWGSNHISTEKAAHTPSGETSSGNAHRCIHDDSWATIIANNNKDPYIYEQCIAAGCTQTVDLSKNETTSILNENFTVKVDGDGPSMLYEELLQNNNTDYSNLKWNLTLSTDGGWANSNIRAMLNGGTNYTDGNCLFYTLPQELQNAIGQKAVKYDSVYDDTSGDNTLICYDKLWLFSGIEVGDETRPKEGTTYERYTVKVPSELRIPYRVTSSVETERVGTWLRSASTGNPNRVREVESSGSTTLNDTTGTTFGVSFGFTLKRATQTQ